MPVTAKRSNIRFTPNPKRVITRLFMPDNEQRACALIQTILQLPQKDIKLLFNQTLRQFSDRHRNIAKILENNFNNVKYLCEKMKTDCSSLPKETKYVIGAFFTKEYSIESAAFFNPSIVEDPYQGNLEKNQKRIIVSFRATGEGHLSSIVFRSGIITEKNEFIFKPAGDYIDVPEIVTRPKHNKKRFLKKLEGMNIEKKYVSLVMDQLKDHFIYGELQAAISNTLKNPKLSYTGQRSVQTIKWLARSHYEVTFSLDTAISDRVLFPISYAESNGIEDARFVRFVDKNSEVTYYATYTANNGFCILPKLIETKDFYHFRIRPIHGENVQNKGLALFPKKIRGQYAMLSRMDGINIHIMFSDDITLWQNTKKILEPRYPWEFVQIGNAGSPIETEHGWLMITHGVGPVRTYTLGAALLDLDDPTKVISRLKEPLLIANEEERDGYVPNVVYSCGAIVHNNELIVPYAMSDYQSTIVCFPLDELFAELRASA